MSDIREDFPIGKLWRFEHKYRGFRTIIHWSAEDNCYYGELEDIRDSVSFDSETLGGVLWEFYKAVDEYIEYCEAIGKVAGT